MLTVYFLITLSVKIYLISFGILGLFLDYSINASCLFFSRYRWNTSCLFVGTSNMRGCLYYKVVKSSSHFFFILAICTLVNLCIFFILNIVFITTTLYKNVLFFFHIVSLVLSISSDNVFYVINFLLHPSIEITRIPADPLFIHNIYQLSLYYNSRLHLVHTTFAFSLFLVNCSTFKIFSEQNSQFFTIFAVFLQTSYSFFSPFAFVYHIKSARL